MTTGAIVLAALLAMSAPVWSADLGLASQEYFVPMPEELSFAKTFRKISSTATAPIHTLISVTISTNGTVVYWDHWEDGYEDPLDPSMQSTTVVWGDGNAANGCAPNHGLLCTDENDRLFAGQAVILENSVELPRALDTHVLYDGGDNIKTTYPVAVTRGAYAQKPGSLLAGATEVYDTGYGWGTVFLSPVGTDANIDTDAFQYVALYCQAKEDNTTVAFNGGKSATLNKGETLVYEYVHVSDELTASKPVQVHIVTGDRGSMYEMRWFTLLPRGLYSRSFVAPVGNTKAGVALVFFNPNEASVDVTYQWLSSDSTESVTVTVPSLSNRFSTAIPTGSGAFIDSDGGEIIVMAIVDTMGEGQIYDWGFPVMPRDSLTPQVLVGLGYGCTSNVCDSKGPRSVIYVTPVEDADLFVDFDNDGTVDETRSIKALSSNIVMDANDTDMSGAFLFATKAGSGEDGIPVKIAAAWGQNPDLSYPNDEFALDLGTVVVPLPTLVASAHVELVIDENADGLVSPGDTVACTIRVSNQSVRHLAKGSFTIVDPVLEQMTYIAGSTKYACSTNATFFKVADNKNGTAFPLDAEGFTSRCTLHGKGCEHAITFQAKVVDADQATNSTLTIRGIARSSMGQDIMFETSVPLVVPTEAPSGAPTAGPTGLRSQAPVQTPSVTSSPPPSKGGCVKRKNLKHKSTKTEGDH